MVGKEKRNEKEMDPNVSGEAKLAALKRKKRILFYKWYIVIYICLALVVGGIVFAVTGFGYKESETSKLARTGQTMSDYYGDGYDFTDAIDYSATTHVWMGIGGIAMVVIGLVGLAVSKNFWDKYKKAKKELTEAQTQSEGDESEGDRGQQM